MIGEEEVTEEQQRCCNELYALLSRKTKDGPKIIVRNLESLPKSRGARAWYRIVREAEGQRKERATELTENIHGPHRKPVEAKNLALALEKFEAEVREYEAITGKKPDDHALTLALERMLPKEIRSMLQTVDTVDGVQAEYRVCPQAGPDAPQRSCRKRTRGGQVINRPGQP